MKIHEDQVINFLKDTYPLEDAEEWDFVGYSLKTKNQEKELNILICLDVNNKVIDYAIKQNTSLIISFHPFKFGSTWDEIYQYDNSKENLVRKLKENKINVFSIHTNFDKSKEGTKYWFAKKLGLLKKVIKEYPYAYQINYENSMMDLAKLLKQKLNINALVSNVDSKYFIEKLYVAPGASNVYDFIDLNDFQSVLLTSDIKWHEQQLLNDLNYNFIMMPHKTEDVFIEAIYEKLIHNYKKIKIEKFYIDDFWKVY